MPGTVVAHDPEWDDEDIYVVPQPITPEELKEALEALIREAQQAA